MFCNRCGSHVNDGEAICRNCGNQVAAPSSGSKLKSTFKGGTTTPSSTVTYNPTPMSNPVSTPVSAPMEPPVSGGTSYSEPLAAPSAYDGGYSSAPASAYTGGYSSSGASAPSYGGFDSTPTPPITSGYSTYSGPSSYVAVKKPGNQSVKIILAIAVFVCVYFLPFCGTSGGLFPDEYTKSWEWLDRIFSNFDEVFEGFGEAGLFLVFMAPIGVLIGSLVNSKVTNMIASAVGIVAIMFILGEVFFELIDWYSAASDLGADVNFFEMFFEAFFGEDTPFGIGIYAALGLFIANLSVARKG